MLKHNNRAKETREDIEVLNNMRGILTFLTYIIFGLIAANCINVGYYNKYVFAQGLQHAVINAPPKDDVQKAEEDAANAPNTYDKYAPASTLKRETLEHDLKHLKTVTYKQAIDAQRFLTTDGDIVYLEGLYVPDTQDNDVNTMAFLNEHFKDKEIDLYVCKERGCKQNDRLGDIRAHGVTQKDHIWIQGLLLRSGFAQMRTRKDWPYLIDAMYEAEKIGQSDKSGLWSTDGFSILDAKTIADTHRGYSIVEGRVYSVAMVDNKVYLNFADNWRKDFTIVVPSDVRRDYSKYGVDIMGSGGKKLRVRGWVDYYNGPTIEIDHMQQIEWVNGEDNKDIENNK